ncbi:hypothetical protein [Corynebacterium sp.]|uniref:hypothetical protein n=1 Tax=Corynebacterium sp. TaxID=1720 RepID=UPI0026DD7E3F|nr:hypothetical protein [Corynebacterium sp.]MDO4610722.1 hypothetical protein [Corynebacterium sp.]
MKHHAPARALALAAAAAAAAVLAACGSGGADGGTEAASESAASPTVSVDPDAPPLDQTGTTYNFTRSYDDGRMVSLGHATTAYSEDGWTGVLDSSEPQFSSLDEGVYEIVATKGSCPGAGESLGGRDPQVIGELHVDADGTVTVHNRPAEIDSDSVGAVMLADGDEVAGCGKPVKWTRPSATEDADAEE